MRNVKNELSALRSRIVSLETALRSLIEEPDNMALMNLTKLGEDPSLYRLPLKPELMAAHEEIEELLEAYLVDCNNQEASLSNLLMRMQNAEQLMSLKLDTARNQVTFLLFPGVIRMPVKTLFKNYVMFLFVHWLSFFYNDF